LTEWKLFKLFECFDPEARSAVVDAELRLERKRRGKSIVLARGRVEPMFGWRTGEAFRWHGADLAREVPPTQDAADAGDLAWSVARYLGAFAVYRDESEWAQRLVAARYQAVFDFETLELDAPAKREPRVRQQVGWLLAQLAKELQSMFVRYGSAGGLEYARHVSDAAALSAAFAAHVARDLPVRAQLDSLVGTMSEWAMRAAIPPAEALALSIDIKGAAEEWSARR
jgi:hypothetical protein